jgi:hypothetical protein
LIKLLNEERALIENDIKVLCKNLIILIDKTLLKEAKEVKKNNIIILIYFLFIFIYFK